MRDARPGAAAPSGDPQLALDRREFPLGPLDVERLEAAGDRRQRGLARGAATRRRARAWRRRRRAPRSISPLQWRTMSTPAASTAAARSSNGPPSAFIDRSSLMIRPSKPIAPRMISRDHDRRRRRGAVGIDRRVDDDARVIAIGRSASAANGAKSRSSSLARGVDDRQFEMAVDARAAMAGHMLDRPARRRRRAARRRRRGPAPPRARVAEENALAPITACMPGSATSSDRRAIDIDPDLGRSCAMSRAARRAAASARAGSSPRLEAAAAG